MSHNYKKVFSFVCGLLLILSAQVAFGAEERQVRKIVVFKQGILNDDAREALVSKFGGVKIKDLKSIEGKAVSLSAKSTKALEREKGVLRIDDDVVVEAVDKNRTGSQRTPSQPAQVTPWGISDIGAPNAWVLTVGATVKVGVIDTGIDLAHPDLSLNIKGGYNAIYSTKSANDDNGHGTHVAGIIAALNNSIGVVGVAPSANLYAIKVLDRNGSGYLSDVIEGLDWAATHGMQVVNMSLGTSVDVQSMHDAVIRARAAGVVEVAAAGNSGGAVIYPAAYPEVIAVSAVDNTNTVTSWSSRGPAVDLAAPGNNIFSTYKGQTYATLSGTSMATPHVTGSVALLLTMPAKCDLDLNGVCDPAEVQQRLESTARDLGVSGKDDLYGSGLVDVAAALTR